MSVVVALPGHPVYIIGTNGHIIEGTEGGVYQFDGPPGDAGDTVSVSAQWGQLADAHRSGGPLGEKS